jgi:hypothetical protein
MRGGVGGRPPALTPAQKVEVRRMRDIELRRMRKATGLPKNIWMMDSLTEAFNSMIENLQNNA